MYFSSFVTSLKQSLVLTVLVLLGLSLASAEVRSSTNYQLQSDSINFGGGLSTSTNYTLESTAGEVATGDADSATYSLRSGYQQMQEVFLSITAADNVSMTPDLGGLTGGQSNGSTTVTVITDSPSGYEMSFAAEGSPAMQGVNGSIANYTSTASPFADYNFNTSAGVAHFGFSPEGVDISGRYLDNGSNTCGSPGSLDTAFKCWDPIITTDRVIAVGGSNHPDGATTTINFRLEIGADAAVIEGTYVATTTLTVIPI